MPSGPNWPSPARRDRRFLRTSPEFACKKLLAAGERRIVEFARVFRNRERGPLHHPEFTMIEWYRAHGRYELLMDDCMAVMARAAQTVGTRRVFVPRPQPRSVRRAGAADGREAFERYAGIDLMATLPTGGARPARASRRMAIDAGVHPSPDDDTWGDIFSRVLVEKIEPHLGHRAAPPSSTNIRP